MRALGSKDFLAGLVALVLGLLVAWGASDLRFGTPVRMGPGFFPVALGGLLALCGAGIMVSALKASDALEGLNLRPLVVLPLVLLGFALLLPRLGYGPAGLVAVLGSAFAERRPALATALLLAAVLVPASWALFALGLGVPLPLLRWNL